MENSKIGWCHHTCNFWYGCTKVSPACEFCYAENQMDTRFGRVEWGGERRRTGPALWKAPFKWNRAAEAAGERHRVFTLSLGDFWDNQVPKEWRVDGLGVVRQCQSLDWLILSKRPQNILRMLPADWGERGWPNVWLGCTVENMVEARRRIPVLLRVPAAVHFLSCEPLLEPLDLSPWLGRGLDWVIVGGETGRSPRLMQPDWARALRDQCAATRTAFFMKQMTRRAPIPTDLLVQQFPDVKDH